MSKFKVTIISHTEENNEGGMNNVSFRTFELEAENFGRPQNTGFFAFYNGDKMVHTVPCDSCIVETLES